MGRITPKDINPKLVASSTQLSGTSSKGLQNLTNTKRLPATTFDTDGKFWEVIDVMGTTGVISIYNDSATQLYTFVNTDINTATSKTMTYYTGNVWLDTVDAALYFIVMNSDATFSTLKITEAGVLSLVGTSAVNALATTTSLVGAHTMRRASQGSGDFTCIYGNEIFTVNSSTGAITVTDTLLNAGSSTFYHLTNDKKYISGTVDYDTTTGLSSVYTLYDVDNEIRYPEIKERNTGTSFFTDTRPLNWGGYIVGSNLGTTGTAYSFNYTQIDESVFDEYIRGLILGVKV